MHLRAAMFVWPFACCALAQPVRPGLALVETGGGSLVRAGDSLELKAPAGELLADGDTLIATNASITFVTCERGRPGIRRTLRSGRVVLRAGAGTGGADLTPPEQTAACVLPDLDLNPAIGAVDDPEFDAQAAAGAARSAEAGSLAERVTRAVGHQNAGRYGEAARDYQSIALDWPDQQWARRFALQMHARQKRPTGTGKTYALLVGVSSYNNPGVPPLKFAHEDARLFLRFIEQKARAAAISADWEVLPLINSEASFARIRVLLNEFFGRAGKADSILLYIAAHGITPKPGDGDPNDGYIVLHNSDPQYLARTGISMKFLREALVTHANRVSRVFLFVDTCHADRIGQIRTSRNTSDTLIGGALQPLKEHKVFAFLATESGRSSFEDERYGGGHGAFTYFLMRAWNVSKTDPDYRQVDTDADGHIDVDELVEYVRSNVVTATNRRQIPMYDKRMEDLRVPVDGHRLELKPYLRRMSVPASLATRTPVEVPAGGARAVPWGDPVTLEKRLALEQEGQQLIEKYLEGEESPQTATDFARGVQIYEELLALAGPSIFGEARREFFRGRLLIFGRQYSLAAEHLERSIRLDPGGAYAYNALGIALLEQARYDSAAAALGDAIRRAPHWAYPRHNLGLTYMQRGDYAAAIETYKAAAELAPRYAYLPYNLGLIYQKLNREDDALAEFRNAHEKRSAHAGPPIALGLLSMNRGRYRESRGHFSEARRRLVAAPNQNFLLALRHNEGLLHARTGDLDGARTLWRENINSSSYMPSRFALARALAEAGRREKASRHQYYAEAISEYQCIVSAVPSNAGARLEFAALLERAGELAAAEKVLREGLAHHPGHPELRSRLRSLGRRMGA